MSRPEQKLFAALIALGLLLGLWAGWQRSRVEAANRTVEMVVDWGQVQEVAASAGLRPMALLEQLRDRGVTGVAVTEDTPASLRDQALLVPQVRHSAAPGGTTRFVTQLTSPSPEVMDRVAAALSRRVGTAARIVRDPATGRAAALELPGTLDQYRSSGLGLSEADTAALRAAGFDIVGRVANYPAGDVAALEWTLSRLKHQGARVVLFSGEEVLGYLERLQDTADLMDRLGLLYGSVEFSKQRGDESLSRYLRSRLLRVHSVSPVEIGRLRVPELVDRYVRAVEERNIRLAYLRLPGFVTQNEDQSLLGYVSQIRDGLARSGFRTGLAQPYEPFYPPKWIYYAMGAGSTASLFLLLTWLFPLSTAWWLLLYVLGTGTDLAAMAVVPNFARRYLALKAALVLPSLAVLWAYRRSLGAMPGAAPGTPARRPTPMGGFLITSAISVCGAVYVVGLLSDRDFMVKTYQFMGIKAAHLLPLVGLALVMGFHVLADGRPWTEQWEGLKARVRGVMDQPLLLWQLVAAGALALALLLLIARTGNEPGVGVSGLELRFRDLLDKILVVRPRTKEFLIGHPLLYLGLALGPLLGRRWLVVLLLLGAIGQVSLINTFCHIHTPLHVSLLRAFNGLWVGLVLGVVAAWFVRPLVRVGGAKHSPRADKGASRVGPSS